MTSVKHIRNRILHHNYAERLNKYIWHCSFREISLQTAPKTASLNRSEQNSYQIPSHFAVFSPTSPFTPTLFLLPFQWKSQKWLLVWPKMVIHNNPCITYYMDVWRDVPYNLEKHGKRLYFHRHQFHSLQLAKTEVCFKVIKIYPK